MITILVGLKVGRFGDNNDPGLGWMMVLIVITMMLISKLLLHVYQQELPLALIFVSVLTTSFLSVIISTVLIVIIICITNVHDIWRKEKIIEN